MTTNISEKSFKELNTLMSEISVQLEELNKKKEEISAAIQNRKEQVVSDYIRHVNQLMEDTRLMVEMGIDPTTISADTTDAVVDMVEEPSVPSIDVVAGEDLTEPVPAELDVLVSEEHDGSDTSDITAPVDVREYEECSKPKELKKGVYRPFFYLLGKRNGAFTKNGTTSKNRKSTRLLTPFYKLAGSELINRSLPMGNLKYRENYPNPDETRIYSADGIAPTITFTHSDLHIWVGPRHHRPTEPTPLTDAA